MSPTVVIPAIFGQQQAAIAQAFHQRGWQVRGTSRTATSHPFAKLLQADPSNGEGLVTAFQGAEVVAFGLVQDHRPGQMVNLVKQVVQAAEQAGVKRILFNVAGTIDEKSNLPIFTDMRAARALVQNSAIPATVFQPTIYMDNLLAPWSLPGIANNAVLAYPAPEHAPIAWISQRTLADYFVAAAENPVSIGKEYPLGGPDLLTGSDLTHTLSQHLGKDIAYFSVPLDAMAAGLNEAMGAPAGERIVSLYARLTDEPQALAIDSAAAAELNVKGESFADFVKRHNWV